MKQFAFLILIASLTVILNSCDFNEDDYSLSNSWIGFGLIQKDSDDESFTILLDDGEILFPATSTEYWDDLKNNERVLTNFTILDEKENTDSIEQYYVRINMLRKILYKGILDITPEIEDSIGNDPIKVRKHWISNHMLNFELQYRGGTKTHLINLVKQPGVINPDDGPVVLELRHNNNNDIDDIQLAAMVTFDLSTLKVPGKTSTSFKVIAKDFDGKNFEFTSEYKY
jgi:hypothetical protein